ncbi:hypothetical protein D4R20_02645 [bacterium]|nr:MAG: hypothetical protein D4R20_02645 [bacterium]
MVKNLFCFFLVFLFISVFNAESVAYKPSNNLSGTDSVSFKPNEIISFIITRQDNQDIVIDGALTEPVWSRLDKLSNFSEFQPGDNVKPPVNTDVMMFYDEDFLYVGFICYENDMSKVRKTLTERDKAFNDDFIGISLDTYGEGKQAYEFIVNPYGVQGDLMWTAPANEDENFDLLWYSAAKLYKDKWTCEIKIPFKSLRFPHSESQRWKFHLYRNRPRENREQYSWVPLSRDAPTLFSRAGALNGIKNIKGGNNFEILPYIVGSQAGNISDNDNADSDFQNDKVKGQTGLNLKYGITSNLTAEFALNPDFSQVESDAAVIDVNNTFALFYPEKRPFFNEGSSIFHSPENIIYTRSINNPLFALKLTGKVGKYEIGFISGYDRKTPFLLPFQEYSNYFLTDRKSFSNIFRLKRILDNDSYIGILVTDREVNKESDKLFDVDGYNRVLGIDGNLRFLEKYSFTFQALKFITKEINFPGYINSDKFENGKYTAALNNEGYSGYGGTLSLKRIARHWNFDLSYNDASPEARPDNGFFSNNNIRRLTTSQSYIFYNETGIINRIIPSLFGFIRHDYNGRLKEQFLNTQISVQLKNQVNFDLGFFLVNNEDFGGVYNQGVRRGSIDIEMNTYKSLRGSLGLEIGKYIVRDVPSYIGYGYKFDLNATFKPIDKLLSENEYEYFELSKNYRGEKLFAGYILRNKTSFQFNNKFSLRLITQFDSFNNEILFNPLLSYKLNAFTIFYIGSTHDYAEIQSIRSSKPVYVLTGRQFFLKFQYLWAL